jgi:hypothetical protein
MAHNIRDRALVVLFSGGFALGVVVVAGGLRLAGELRGLGLTGTDVLAALPRSELLTRGADSLGPFVIGGAVLVAAGEWLSKKCGAKKRDLVAVAAGVVIALLGFGTLYLFAKWPRGAGTWPWFAALAVLALFAGLIWRLWADSATYSKLLINEEWLKLTRLGAAMVLGTLTFCLTVAYARGFGRPEARPAAVLLKDGTMVDGAWVAASGDWVYVGKIDWHQYPPDKGFIVAIPRDSVAGYAYGKRAKPSEASDALHSAERCALALVTDHKQAVASPAPKSVPSPTPSPTASATATASARSTNQC